MDVARLHRLSFRLAALEDFYVHEDSDDSPEKRQRERFVYEGGEKGRQRDYRIVRSPATKRKLESWFGKRDIAIRIIYTEQRFKQGDKYLPDVTPIGKSGVITFVYMPVGQEPPTAWMIAHNLSHAIFERQRYYKESPYEKKDMRRYLSKEWETKHNLMGGDSDRPAIYPTTKSRQRITETGEGFHELFTQWVVKGKVILDPRNPELEKELENKFRYNVEELEDEGAVVYNL